MAFPMFVGPGTLSTVVVMAAEAGIKYTVAGVLVAFVLMSVLLYFAAFIERILGELVLVVTAKIMQVFIGAMGIKMILTGLGIDNIH